MWTSNCYAAIDRQFAARSMFSASLEHAAHLHCAIITEIADSILEWAVPLKEAVPVLVQLGYNNSQISDAVRTLREEEAEIKELEAVLHGSVAVATEEEEEE